MVSSKPSAATAEVRPPANVAAAEPELSVVIPCLNEAETVGICVRKSLLAMKQEGIVGEVVVADNGSSDGSQQIASAEGARVVTVEARGYGSALMGGIASARGKYLIMGDADDSYDFGDIHKFVVQLRAGYDLVQGCRLPSGGGTVEPRAMPFLHRWLGNPLLTWIARKWFRTRMNDVYCGMRGFTKSLYESLDQRCTGMEFAVEMIVKASLRGERVTEVPIALRPDGRKAHAPHLKTWRDGWRTLRFFLMYSPRWLFLVPGLLVALLGLLGYMVALPGLTLGGVTFDAHTLLFSSLAILIGYQSVLFAVFTKTFAIAERLMPEDPRMTRLFQILNLERGLVASLVLAVCGGGLLASAVMQWRSVGFGRLDYAHTMRFVIPGATLAALGFQSFLSSFFISILGLKRR